MDSPLIKDTDSVTLSCQAPVHVSVHECRFYVNGGTQTHFPCIKTFTGTELLLMAKKSLPSVVEVRCYYTVKYESVISPSPHSETSFITISKSLLPSWTGSSLAQLIKNLSKLNRKRLALWFYSWNQIMNSISTTQHINYFTLPVDTNYFFFRSETTTGCKLSWGSTCFLHLLSAWICETWYKM